MQKMQRSDVSEHFSAAKTVKSVLPRLVIAQRGKVLAMTMVWVREEVARLNCGTELELAAIAEACEPEAG
jgi:hypothetical protein